jgi:hypothetical protein
MHTVQYIVLHNFTLHNSVQNTKQQQQQEQIKPQCRNDRRR